MKKLVTDLDKIISLYPAQSLMRKALAKKDVVEDPLTLDLATQTVQLRTSSPEDEDAAILSLVGSSLLQEDHAFIAALSGIYSSAETIFTFLGIIGAAKTHISLTGHFPTSIFVPRSIWEDLVGDAEFYRAFRPVLSHDLLVSGCFGSFEFANIPTPMYVYTDSYRHPNYQVLPPNQIILASAPDHCGAYTAEDVTYELTGDALPPIRLSGTIKFKVNPAEFTRIVYA